MKKIYFSVMLMFITSAFALCQVTVSFTLTSGATSLSVPPQGLSGVSATVTLSKPTNLLVVDGFVYIYAKGNSSVFPAMISPNFVPSFLWSGSGGTQSVVLSVFFSVSPSDLNNTSGKLYAQYESQTQAGTPIVSKSADINATIPISNNTLTPPTITSFNVSGDPSVLNGTTPAGGTGTFTYQWQSSTTSTTAGFSNIASATNQNYDPPTISQTTYYRRVVTSGSINSISNVVTITVSAFPPISNNSISNSGASSFNGSGDPAILNGTTPAGGTGTFTYQWQSSTTSSTAGFSNIPSATNQNYDPSTINQTTYYSRVVTSGSISSTSNVVTITIKPIGSTFDNPIDIGNLDICSNYGDNRSPIGYGNEFGNSYEDIFYKFNLIRSAKISLYNCKSDGTSTVFYLLDGNGNFVQGGTTTESCDVGIQVDFDLQAGTYYVVNELQDSYTVSANFDLYVFPIVSASAGVTITPGGSATLSASGAGAVSYSWHPSTGLNSTTGSNVIASPSVSTTYLVTATWANGCTAHNSIRVNVTGAVGSTMNNAIVTDISGCGYTSPVLYMNGYGNEYGGGSLDDIFFKFSLSSASEVRFYIQEGGYWGSDRHLVLLNNSGAFIDEQYYGWIDSGDDAGTGAYVALDGTPFTTTLQPGTYFLVAETLPNEWVIVHIDTPSGYSCRKRTVESPLKKEVETPLKNESTILYPNPANQYISFDLESNIPTSLYFIDTNGTTIKEATITGTSLNISDLPGGLYFVKIVQGNEIRYEKLLIER